MIERTEYLDFLKKLKDKNIIKVVTGIKRCGKSTLFELYKKYLLENGINKNQIISLNFEKTVDGLFINKNVDLYITGSNYYMLSGELATYLTGRYM